MGSQQAERKHRRAAGRVCPTPPWPLLSSSTWSKPPGLGAGASKWSATHILFLRTDRCSCVLIRAPPRVTGKKHLLYWAASTADLTGRGAMRRVTEMEVGRRSAPQALYLCVRHALIIPRCCLLSIDWSNQKRLGCLSWACVLDGSLLS